MLRFITYTFAYDQGYLQAIQTGAAQSNFRQEYPLRDLQIASS
jgi:hypothetical protein